MARVTIMIPTQRRPDGLAVAARSVFGQVGVDPATLELVIVDNDQVPSARPVAEDLAKNAPFPLIYVHEPKAGVANARNAGMAKASGDLIAFLDDDEEVVCMLDEMTASQKLGGRVRRSVINRLHSN